MFTLLKQRRLRWLGHVVRMDDGWIPQDLLGRELVQGKRPTGRLHLHYKEGSEGHGYSWEAIAIERTAWKQKLQKDLTQYKESLAQQSETKRQRRQARSQGD